MTEPQVLEAKKPYKIKDVTRNTKKAMVAMNLKEVQKKAAEIFEKAEPPLILLDIDGTEIDDEDYFQTLEPNTELIAVFPGEQWTDPTHYYTITTRHSQDFTDCGEVCAEVEKKTHLKKLVTSLVKNNLCSVSLLNEEDLEMLSNMDPNSVADITGKDFIEQLKETSGRVLFEKRQAIDAVELLKILKNHHDLFARSNVKSTTGDPSSEQGF